MNRNVTYSFLWPLSILTIVIHLAAAVGGYGIFRDELYYIACANHPDLGYVDHPPLSIWLLSAWTALFTDSLFSLRIIPALCAGLTTFLVGRLCQAFGGGRYAVVLAALVTMLAPIFLAFFGLYTMNAIDLVLWALAFLVLVRLMETRDPRQWYLLGAIVGLGALNKLSMLWLGAGIFAGFLLTVHRVVLRSPAPWIAGLIGALLFLPFVIWNMTHDWAHLEFIRNASTDKYGSQTPLTFLSGLPLLMNPLALPVWGAGFWFLAAGREFRPVGIAILTVLVILLVNIHSKPEYFAAAMTALVPAGSVQLERWLQGRRSRLVRWPYAVVLLVSGLILAPLTVDFLPVETFVRYQARLGLTPPSTEGHRMGDLPQHYADRFGWREMAGVVGRVYASLPDSEKQRTVVYGRNYGEAGAIDYFGRVDGLPPAISQHNSYWYWSLDHLRQDAVIIVIGVPKTDLLEDFEDVREAGVIRSEHAMPYENDLPVCVCRKPGRPVRELWNSRKIFI